MEVLSEKIYIICLKTLRLFSDWKSTYFKERAESIVGALIGDIVFLRYGFALKELTVLKNLLSLKKDIKDVDLIEADKLLGLIEEIMVDLRVDSIESEKPKSNFNDLDQSINDDLLTIDNGEVSLIIEDDQKQSPIEQKLPQSLDEIIKNAKSRSLISNIDNVVDKTNKDSAISNRQSAILEKVKKDVNCRMKDLMLSFTDVSERTLRNDLQKMCDQGLIRRVGGGGPYTFYTAKL